MRASKLVRMISKGSRWIVRFFPQKSEILHFMTVATDWKPQNFSFLASIWHRRHQNKILIWRFLRYNYGRVKNQKNPVRPSRELNNFPSIYISYQKRQRVAKNQPEKIFDFLTWGNTFAWPNFELKIQTWNYFYNYSTLN